jgi:hypothetical protein
MNLLGRRPNAAAFGHGDKSLHLLQIDLDA